MAHSALDGLPQWAWFLGLDLKTSALIIATLGVMHPMAYVYASCVYRSPLFLTIYLLVAAWAAFSMSLFAGIIQGQELAYELWEWFSLVFAALMVLLMAVLLVLCAGRCACAVPVLAVPYYLLTLYTVCVVNSQRREAFPPRGE